MALVCLPDLSAARYPAEALAARIQGTVNISFRFDEQGRPTDFASGSHPLLAASAAAALRSAPALPNCAGESASLQLVYTLTAGAPAQPVARRAAALYEILAENPTIETVISDPAWTFSRRGRVLHRLKGWCGGMFAKREAAAK